MDTTKREVASTSIEAYRKVQPHTANMREQVFDMVKQSPDGITCFEIEDNTGWVRSTVSSRITELRKAERIKDSGARRKTASGCNARVYVAA